MLSVVESEWRLPLFAIDSGDGEDDVQDFVSLSVSYMQIYCS